MHPSRFAAGYAPRADISSAPPLGRCPRSTDPEGKAPLVPPLPADLRRGQPEGWRRQDDDRREPRGLAWPTSATGRWSSTSIRRATPSTGLGIDTRNLETSMYDVIMHELPLEDCVEPTSVKNLFVAPASLDLAGAEIELVPAFSRELRLRRASVGVHGRLRLRPHRLPAVARPADGQRAGGRPRGAGADPVRVLRPRGPRPAAAQRRAGPRSLNPTLEVTTIVLVMYDARTKLADQVVQEVRDHFGDKVCRTVDPPDGAALRGAVVRAADHRLRSDVPGGDRLRGAGQGGERRIGRPGRRRGDGGGSRRWLGVAGSVRAWPR